MLESARRGIVYHVLNCVNAWMTIFENDDADDEAFEAVLQEAVERTEMRLLAYGVMPNHWHPVLWPREDGDVSRFTGWPHSDAHAALARAPRQRRERARVSGPVQVLSHPKR
ncbi:MAG: transposase [Planctomycetota bacterium]